jgi:hypothetical protein
MIGKHITTKKVTDPTYSKEWSGVSYAPHCKKGCTCPKCGEKLHNENGNHYCPQCDDYVAPSGTPHEAQ